MLNNKQPHTWKTWTFVRDGIPEDVAPERWRWMVTNGDGSTCKQFDDNGNFHQIKEINQNEPFVFEMYNEASGQSFKLFVNAPLAKLKYFYRNIVLEMGTPQERRIKLYIFAYKLYDVYHYHAIMPDDTLIITTDLNLITVA